MPTAAAQPQVDASTVNEIFARTTFGAIKAVVGSQHAFRRKAKKKVVIASAKDGKKSEVEVDIEETFFRTVYSIHQHRSAPQKWIALGTDLTAPTEDELLGLIYATHGGPDAMRKAGKRIVYCAETSVEIDVHTSEGGELVIRREVALLSDREPGN
jgi:hypothetical protein